MDRAPSTAELLADRIRAAISTGEFAAGEALPQEELAARYGVSRSPLREALRLLEAQGSILYHSNRGAVVSRFDLDDVVQIFEIRRLLEAALIEHAIPKLTPERIEESRARLWRLKNERRPREWLSEHLLFHLELYSAAERPRMLALVEQNIVRISHLPNLEKRVAHLRSQAHADDAALLDACAQGKVSRAIAITLRHLNNAEVQFARDSIP